MVFMLAINKLLMADLTAVLRPAAPAQPTRR
jgi:hypothetical protein